MVLARMKVLGLRVLMFALWSVARDGRGFVLTLTDTNWIFFVVSSTTLVAMVGERKSLEGSAA